MPRPCIVCEHSRRGEIEVLSAPGQGGNETHRAVIRRVSKQYGLSPAGLWRHVMNHLLPRLARDASLSLQTPSPGLPANNLTHEQRILDRIHTYIADLVRLRDKAERGEKYRDAILAVDRLIKVAELEARMHGLLRLPGSGSERQVVHVTMGRPLTAEDHAQALREARLLLEFEEDEKRDRAALETTAQESNKTGERAESNP
jgi:hypothetical protein